MAKLAWTKWSDVLKGRLAEYEDMKVREAMGEPLNLFIPTGIKLWDANGGISIGVLTVLAGMDGQGKSIVKNHLRTTAAKAGYNVASYDFEDPADKTADRDFSTMTRVNSRHLGLGTFDKRALDLLYAARREADEWASRVWYHGGLTDADEILESLNALAEDEATRPKLVLIDYAQALPSDGEEGLERQIARMAWDLNVFAQKYQCAVVVFSQVKAEITNRGQAAFWAGKKRDPDSWDVSGYCPGPTTQDLGRCIALGQRARAVGYIYRPGDYERKMGKPGALDNRLFIRWGKVNFGESGMMPLGFDGPTARLYDYTGEVL